jgi:hypothetical protein
MEPFRQPDEQGDAPAQEVSPSAELGEVAKPPSRHVPEARGKSPFVAESELVYDHLARIRIRTRRLFVWVAAIALGLVVQAVSVIPALVFLASCQFVTPVTEFFMGWSLVYAVQDLPVAFSLGFLFPTALLLLGTVAAGGWRLRLLIRYTRHRDEVVPGEWTRDRRLSLALMAARAGLLVLVLGLRAGLVRQDSIPPIRDDFGFRGCRLNPTYSQSIDSAGVMQLTASGNGYDTTTCANRVRNALRKAGMDGDDYVAKLDDPGGLLWDDSVGATEVSDAMAARLGINTGARGGNSPGGKFLVWQQPTGPRSECADDMSKMPPFSIQPLLEDRAPLRKCAGSTPQAVWATSNWATLVPKTVAPLDSNWRDHGGLCSSFGHAQFAAASGLNTKDAEVWWCGLAATDVGTHVTVNFSVAGFLRTESNGCYNYRYDPPFLSPFANDPSPLIIVRIPTESDSDLAKVVGASAVSFARQCQSASVSCVQGRGGLFYRSIALMQCQHRMERSPEYWTVAERLVSQLAQVASALDAFMVITLVLVCMDAVEMSVRFWVC